MVKDEMAQGGGKVLPDAKKNVQADPRVVQAYQGVVAAAGKVIYDKGTSAELVNMVRAAEDPVSGTAQAVLLVLDQIKGAVKGVHPNFVYTAAPIVSAMVLELAEAAGIVQFDEGLIGKATEAIVGQLKGRGGQQGPAPSPEQQPAKEQPAPGAAQAPAQEDLEV